MILKIILGITALQLFFNFFQYFLLKRAILGLKIEERERADLQDKQMSQIENDLNTRLREIQTAQFSPRMAAPVIRLFPDRGEDLK